MPTYPYIPAPGAVVKAFEQLRKSFPGKVDAPYLKRNKIAASNESYLIGVLRFLGLIDEEGNRQDGRVEFFYGSEEKFQAGVDALLRDAYKQLFDEMGDDVFSRSREDLGHWFRSADKTTELVGKRQAATFHALAALAGHTDMPQSRPSSSASKPRSAEPRRRTSETARKEAVGPKPSTEVTTSHAVHSRSDVGLTVRIEVNLPAGGDADTYDAIFASIKRNLIP